MEAETRVMHPQAGRGKEELPQETAEAQPCQYLGFGLPAFRSVTGNIFIVLSTQWSGFRAQNI
jgi:hypothetical protein